MVKRDAPVGVAQVGVGYWGPNLLRALNANSGFELRAVADASADRRDFVARTYSDLQVHADEAPILDDSRIGAVALATPAASHFEMALRCIRARKHVLVEKPMAMSVAEVDQLAAAAREAGVVLMAAHTFVYNDAIRYLKQLITTGELGDLRYITSQRLNLGRVRSDVDALWNLAPHDVSIVQYLLDDPTPVSVQRHGMDFIQDGIDDVAFMNISYPNKVIAHIHVSWLNPRKVRQLTVVGSRKMVICDDIAEDKIAIFDKGVEPKAVLGDGMDYDLPPRSEFIHRAGDILIPKVPFREPLRVEVEHFRECIVDGIACLTGPTHAREVIRILEQAQRVRGSAA